MTPDEYRKAAIDRLDEHFDRLRIIREHLVGGSNVIEQVYRLREAGAAVEIAAKRLLRVEVRP